MKHPITKIILPITLSAFLLTGCQSPSSSVSSSSLSQPSTVIPPATVAPLPEEPASSTPTVEPPQGTVSEEGPSSAMDTGDSDYQNEELSEEQIAYIQIFSKYIHEPIEEIDRLKQEPYYIAFLLDSIWIEGSRDGSLSINETPELYGQVLIPINLMNEKSQQLFGFQCDDTYIRSLYQIADTDSVIYYPTDRPFYSTQILYSSFSDNNISALVEIVPGGDGGRTQGVISLQYNFEIMSDGGLRLTSIADAP